jgi:(3S)-linalool synthase
MVEARWLAIDQVPTAEDYLRNGVITSGVPLTFVHIFTLVGCEQSIESLIDQMPSVISCPAKILRLRDDMGSAKVSHAFIFCIKIFKSSMHIMFSSTF